MAPLPPMKPPKKSPIDEVLDNIDFPLNPYNEHRGVYPLQEDGIKKESFTKTTQTWMNEQLRAEYEKLPAEKQEIITKLADVRHFDYLALREVQQILEFELLKKTKILPKPPQVLQEIKPEVEAYEKRFKERTDYFYQEALDYYKKHGEEFTKKQTLSFEQRAHNIAKNSNIQMSGLTVGVGLYDTGILGVNRDKLKVEELIEKAPDKTRGWIIERLKGITEGTESFLNKNKKGNADLPPLTSPPTQPVPGKKSDSAPQIPSDMQGALQRFRQDESIAMGYEEGSSAVSGPLQSKPRSIT